MAYVICVSNVKGGVAKTSTAIALGGVFAKKSHQVLLVDLDAQADLTQGIGIAPSATEFASRNLFIPGILKDFSPASMVKKSKYENLYVIPSNGEIIWNEHRMPAFKGQETVLKDIFHGPLEEAYDFIIVDSPPTISTSTLSAITAADLLIIPTQAEYFSSNALVKMMSVIRLIRHEYNPNIKFRVLVTLLDLRNRIQRHVLEQLRGGFQESMFSNYIEIDTKIRESQDARTPIVNYLPGSRSALQYHNLAEEILALIPELPNQQQRILNSLKIEQAGGQEIPSLQCPFLGLENDPASAMTFPHELNYCHRARPQETPKIEHQRSTCLTGAYITCPLISMNSGEQMPASIQAIIPSIWDRFKI